MFFQKLVKNGGFLRQSFYLRQKKPNGLISAIFIDSLTKKRDLKGIIILNNILIKPIIQSPNNLIFAHSIFS